MQENKRFKPPIVLQIPQPVSVHLHLFYPGCYIVALSVVLLHEGVITQEFVGSACGNPLDRTKFNNNKLEGFQTHTGKGMGFDIDMVGSRLGVPLRKC